MAQLDQITVVIKGEDELSKPATAAVRSLQGLERQAEKTGGVLGGLGKGLAMGAGLGAAQAAIGAISSSLAGLGGALIGSNVELENTRAQLVAMTKSGAAADKILEDIRKEAAKTPFAFKEMAKATASLMPAAKQANVPLMDLVKQAEILAATNPAEGLEGAAFALREALSGDFVSVVERFNLPRQRLKELKEQGVPAIKAISIALKEMGIDSDIVAKRGETLEGRWSTFLDTIQTVAATVGKPIFDVLKDGLMAVQGFLDRNAEAINTWAGRLGEFLGGGARRLLEWAGQAADVLGRLASGQLSVGDLAVSLGRRLLEAVTSVDWPSVARAALDAFGRALAAAGAAASTVASWLGEQWRAVKWDAVWREATGIGAGLLAGARPIAADATAWLVAQWARIDWPAVWKSITEHAATLAANLAPVTTALQEFLTTSAQDVDWDQIWKNARTGEKAQGGLGNLFRNAPREEGARQVGAWLGRMTDDAVVAFVDYLETPGGANANRIAQGVATMWANAQTLALPVMRLTMRAFGFNVVEELVSAYVANLNSAAIIARLSRAITDMWTRAILGAQGAIAAATRSLAGAVGAGVPAAVAPAPSGQGGRDVVGYQHGGSFYVGGAGGPDSQMVAFRATPGERVDVTPPGRAGGAVALTVNNVFHVSDRGDADYLADVLPDALARAVEKARSQQGMPVVSGLTRWT